MNFEQIGFDNSLSMDSLYPIVDVTTGIDVLVRPGQRTLIPDFLDQKYLNMLNGIKAWTVKTYTGQKFTTMCFAEQGTTALWQFNLAFNGLQAEFQMAQGMQIRFPLISEVQRVYAQQNAKNNIGRVVIL